MTFLPSGDVSMILGKRYASFGKTYDGSGTIDVADVADGISINADGDINSRGVKLGNSLCAIYMSVVSTNPATLFGFDTWVTFGAGKTLVGLDASQTEFNSVEETSGAKTHTLATTEIPAHNHTASEDTQGAHTHYLIGAVPSPSVASGSSFNRPISWVSGNNVYLTDSKGGHQHTVSIANSGGGGSHNNLHLTSWFICGRKQHKNLKSLGSFYFTQKEGKPK
ncbi:MAG: hypothetical protein HGB31_02890 [Erysipelotrichaceae bacterium]|nr:hypothetical protein [Erysipelotrichaceae bacterium]